MYFKKSKKDLPRVNRSLSLYWNLYPFKKIHPRNFFEVSNVCCFWDLCDRLCKISVHKCLLCSPNDATISDLTAGEEYTLNIYSESEYGKGSDIVTLTHSLYTDRVVHTETTVTQYSIQFHMQIESGVGESIFLEMESPDDYTSRRKIINFEWVLFEVWPYVTKFDTIVKKLESRNSFNFFSRY